MQTAYRLSLRGALLWILCLALLSVGARNFEEGLSGDAPLYATIARNISRTGEWFRLDAGVPDFVPYVEHPHLGFWVLAAVFQWLPAGDWSARLVGHVFYVGFLFLFFLFVRRRANERTAAGAVLLLWAWFRFSNFFSNVYLDPGALFFGSLACFVLDLGLEKKWTWVAPLAGLCLGLCALYKGIAAIAFLPALVAILLTRRVGRWFTLPIIVLGVLAGFALVALPYVIAIRKSAVPDFLSLYWSRQVSNRFLVQWRWSGLWEGRFWKSLFNDTYWLLPVALVSLKELRRLVLPWVLFVSLVVLYAPTARVGAQYWIWVLPWLAWLVSEGTFAYFPWDIRRVAKVTTVAALAGIAILQYLPFRTHKVGPPHEASDVREAVRLYDVRRLIADLEPPINFLGTSPFAWYGDVEVSHPDPEKIPLAEKGVAYLLVHREPSKFHALLDAEWCLWKPYEKSSLWIPCSNLRL